MENFINFHVLISHSPACLNRDDMNMQKSAMFGGVRRVRYSSQSLKRAMRTSDYYCSAFSRSTRTRYLVDEIFNRLSTEESTDNAALDKAALLVAAMIEGKTKPEELKKYKRAANGKIQHQVIPFTSSEMSSIEGLIKEIAAASESKRIDVARKSFDILQATEANKIDMDVALSGRMAGSDILYGVDGALAMAHAITTHAVDSDIDWFTAVDDLVNDAGEVGAGHLNTQEFSSGVFYRYASLNIGQLQKNLGAAPRERVLDIARHVARLLATVVPSAKQQTFAAHNLADCVLVSFADQPISLANAFEVPVKARHKGEATGFREPSQARLLAHWQTLNSAYGLNERAALFRIEGNVDVPASLVSKKGLQELTDWIASDGQG